MWIPKEREVVIRRYGRYARATNTLICQPDVKQKNGGRRAANANTPKARNNCGTAMHKALAIALNNAWQWYGHLQIANEDTTSFDAVYKFIKTFTRRLQKTRERSESKAFAYLIVPDFEEIDDMQKWFIHIWLMNVPKADIAFVKDRVSEKKIVYHWTKYERQNGKSQLYKIYDSGYVSNNQWLEQNAFQIFDIMERTSSLIPKNKRLYYHSDNVVSDDIIARSAPSTMNAIKQTSTSNPYSYSQWFTSLDLQKNIDEAMKYTFFYDIDVENNALAEMDSLLEADTDKQEEVDTSYQTYAYEDEYIPPVDDYYFCGDIEYLENVEEIDYNVLNDIYENEACYYENSIMSSLIKT